MYYKSCLWTFVYCIWWKYIAFVGSGTNMINNIAVFSEWNMLPDSLLIEGTWKFLSNS